MTSQQFTMDLLIWGCSVKGVSEHAVEVAETGYAYRTAAWDVTSPSHLNGKQVPDWFGMYWVGEHIRRGHAFLSGQ